VGTTYLIVLRNQTDESLVGASKLVADEAAVSSSKVLVVRSEIAKNHKEHQNIVFHLAIFLKGF
jgi:hypothetical protein